MKICIEIRNVQCISSFDFSLETKQSPIMCIVGKNGSGKTTLARSFLNLKSADTFLRTSSPYIFSESSEIRYTIDNNSYFYRFNKKLRTLDSRDVVEKTTLNDIHVELSFPHGSRFTRHQKLGEVDAELRQKIAISDYKKPTELIKLLRNIYRSDHYENLKQVTIKNQNYYFILKPNLFYIREDHLSAGEYFVINLYKIISTDTKLIVIDEIDISLDASAQVNLIEEFRQFCLAQKTCMLITSHSLPLIKTLRETEIHYLENKYGHLSLTPRPYSYVKSILYGFKGWDKYILTEDKILEKYLDHLISTRINSFFHYKLVYVGGGTNVIDLLQRNAESNIFSVSKNVIAILDGDQSKKQYCISRDDVRFIPFESIEIHLKDIYSQPNRGSLPEVDYPSAKKKNKDAKNLYKALRQHPSWSEQKLFDHINETEADGVNTLVNHLESFLKKPSTQDSE